MRACAPSSLFAATAISMKPACETDEYASIRLTFSCVSAAMLPTASEMHAMIAIAHVQRRSLLRERGHEHAVGDDERGRLRRGRHERGHGRGRPLVHVRRPHVERRGRRLEPEAGDHHREADDEQRVVRVRRRADLVEAELAVAP